MANIFYLIEKKMNSASILDMTYKALTLVLLLSAPVVIAAAVTGLLVAVLQAVTQIQDQSIGTAAKFIVVSLAIILTGKWLGGEVYNYGNEMFAAIPVLFAK